MNSDPDKLPLALQNALAQLDDEPEGPRPDDVLEGWPIIEERILVRLEAHFPLVAPRPGDPTDQIMFLAGSHSVVTFLRAVYDYQQEPEDVD